MNTIKQFLFFSVLAGTIVSCSSDNATTTPVAVKDGKITSLTDLDYDATSLKGDITANLSLPKGDYILDGALVVKSGFKLTIAAGSTFKATPGGTNVYLAVEQGAKIDASGTAALPILFTSNSGNPRAGDWGGLLLMGKAPISGGGTATTEVVDFTYGGTDPADNSGTLKYVTVEYTGARINGDKEFNGFTMYSVGSGTVVENIASKYGDDDAIEFFGGTVNVKNILVVNAKDDMLDYTQGYTGTIDNAYCIRELGYNDVTSDPRGVEGDGNFDGLAPTQAGQSNPVLKNITIVSNSVVALDAIIKIRRNSGITMTNSLAILGTKAPAPTKGFVNYTDSKGDAGNTSSVIITGQGLNLDINNNFKGTSTGIITVSPTGATGANTSVFTWTGYAF
ncbi:hypothetical protein [Flavobacterium cellulosilyticum]|uniref:Multidrug transporter n=1 Tax=Flavobacterium cellulosilyticum TaxID=2541731 RepID=A0A4R5CGN3_9FLAO|nr:hypothetical protein [Flavobacterium cellulosilyticum]TDD99281.1 hypothetical protein E0F76_00705 [Flavobacterium cellulosilyticum]